MIFNGSLATASAIDESRRWKDSGIDADRSRSVDSETKRAEVRRLAVLEDLEAIPDRVESCLWLQSGEVEHILGLLWRKLLAHDLARYDMADLHWNIRASANFDT